MLGVETEREQIIPGAEEVEDELSDVQRAIESTSNVNITTGIKGVPTLVHEVPDVDIYANGCWEE